MQKGHLAYEGMHSWHGLQTLDIMHWDLLPEGRACSGTEAGIPGIGSVLHCMVEVQIAEVPACWQLRHEQNAWGMGRRVTRQF